MAKKAATRQKSPAASVAGRLGGQGARFSEADEENLWHGSVVRFPMPQWPADDPRSQTSAEAVAKAVDAAITNGMDGLRAGTAAFAHDVEPKPGAAVEAFNMIDLTTGDYVVAWRVACRVRAKHAN